MHLLQDLQRQQAYRAHMTASIWHAGQALLLFIATISQCTATCVHAVSVWRQLAYAMLLTPLLLLLLLLVSIMLTQLGGCQCLQDLCCVTLRDGANARPQQQLQQQPGHSSTAACAGTATVSDTDERHTYAASNTAVLSSTQLASCHCSISWCPHYWWGGGLVS
jgi:hypothetical protein